MSAPRVLGKAAQARVEASKAQEVDTDPTYDPPREAAPAIDPAAEPAGGTSVPAQTAAHYDAQGNVLPAAAAMPDYTPTRPAASEQSAAPAQPTAGGWLGDQAVAQSLPALSTQLPPDALRWHGEPAPEAPQGARFPTSPGRPNVPGPQDILHLRKITRSSLGVTVPDALELPKRLKRYCLDRDVDVVGDAAAVAIDAWLSAQGY
jgi:hypothetical protein